MDPYIKDKKHRFTWNKPKLKCLYLNFSKSSYMFHKVLSKTLKLNRSGSKERNTSKTMTMMSQPNKVNPRTKMKQEQRCAGLVFPDPISPSHTLTSQAFIGGGG